MWTTLPERLPIDGVPLPKNDHLGGGEISTTLSPLTIMRPSFLAFSKLVVSSVSSRTKFRC